MRFGEEASMTIEAGVLAVGQQVLCDAPRHNTNVFGPGGYKIRCDQCCGRRGYCDKENQWIQCRTCSGTGSVRCPRCHGTGKILSSE